MPQSLFKAVIEIVIVALICDEYMHGELDASRSIERPRADPQYVSVFFIAVGMPKKRGAALSTKTAPDKL